MTSARQHLAVGSVLGIYASADTATQALIDKELNHSRWLDRQGMFLQWAGLISGFLVALLFLAAATKLVLADHGLAGTALGCVDIVGLVSIFVARSRS